MKLSVITPAWNAAAHLDCLLTALLPQLQPGDEFFLVDDGSQDDTAAVAQRHDIRVLRSPSRRGPGAARNLGASHASGDILVFLDADVVPHAGLLERIRQQFSQSPQLSALIGSYDAAPAVTTTVSRFRNLLHCYTHQQGDPLTFTFWAGCGAMRRSAFESLGGFDVLRYPHSSIEDIELGMRLKRSGGQIRLDPTLQVQHRKAWRLWDMVSTDVMRRAIPWTRLIRESGNMPLDLNLKLSQRVSGIATAAALALLLLIPWFPMVAGMGALALLASVIALNAGFYRFLATCGGWWFALRSVPLHLLSFLCGVTGYAIGCMSHQQDRKQEAAVEGQPAGQRLR